MASQQLTRKQCFTILGVSEEAGPEEVKKAFQLKAKKVHPDKNGHVSANEQFAELLAAYHSLMDQNSWCGNFKASFKSFDAEMHQSLQNFMSSSNMSSFNISRARRGSADSPSAPDTPPTPRADLGMSSGIFSHSAHSRSYSSMENVALKNRKVETSPAETPQPSPSASPSFPRASPNSGRSSPPSMGPNASPHKTMLKATVPVSFQEAFFGKEKIVHFNFASACRECSPDPAVVCSVCSGRKEVIQSSTVAIRVPRSCQDGFQIHTQLDSERDLTVVLSVKPHEFYARNGHDARIQINIPYFLLVLGTTLSLPPLEGDKEVKVDVPPNQPFNQPLRVPGAGFFVNQNSDVRGDIFIQFNILNPRLSEEGNALLRQICQLPENQGMISFFK